MTDPNRHPAGIPAGGQFAAAVRAEADVTLDVSADEPTFEQQRLDAYERLQTFGPLGTVSTTAWPEEPNEDGTVDVDLSVVYDEHGDDVESIGGEGAEPAGVLDASAPSGYVTAYDIWREDPENPDSDINLATMHQWHADQRRATALARLNELTTLDEHGHRWAETHEDWVEAARVRLDVQTPTPFTDLRPGDRFVIERPEGGCDENRVLNDPFETLDHRLGSATGYVEVRRQNTGTSGLHVFAPSEMARKIEAPVMLRSEPIDERTLNEAWGV